MSGESQSATPKTNDVPGSSRVPIVVAIDGPAGAGKSTVARLLAEALGYALLDTGAIYRTVALLARMRGIDWEDEAKVAEVAAALDIRFERTEAGNRVFLEGKDVSTEIRTPEISQGASIVSAHPRVRAALLDLQRRAGAVGRVVAEGRDIGTVVFPAATAKFFLTASIDERARRRALELSAQGALSSPEQTRREIEERDARDSSRAAAPLVPASDCIIVDSSGLTPEEVVTRMVDIVRARVG